MFQHAQQRNDYFAGRNRNARQLTNTFTIFAVNFVTSSQAIVIKW